MSTAVGRWPDGADPAAGARPEVDVIILCAHTRETINNFFFFFFFSRIAPLRNSRAFYFRRNMNIRFIVGHAARAHRDIILLPSSATIYYTNPRRLKRCVPETGASYLKQRKSSKNTKKDFQLFKKKKNS